MLHPGHPKMKNGALRDELKNGRGRVWGVPLKTFSRNRGWSKAHFGHGRLRFLAWTCMTRRFFERLCIMILTAWYMS